MTRIEFLKKALAWRCYTKTDWLISIFSVTKEPEDEWKKDSYPGRVVSRPWGYQFVNENLELENIDGTRSSEPLFLMLEEVIVDPSWVPNVKEPKKSLMGALICNFILLIENFKTKIPYIAEDISIRAIESFVINNRTDEKEHETLITLKEYQGLAEGIELLKTIPDLSVYSLTRKNILPPTGLKEFKAKLDEEYEGQLEDPVKLAEYESKLLAFDKEYMKGDPSFGKLVSGKVHNNGRRKLFLSSGAEGGLTGEMVPITQSLLEGVPLNPKNYAAIVNGSRSGSYYRGADTVKGGVSFKILIRILSNFQVVEGDCGTKYGLTRKHTKETIANLVGRTLLEGRKIENINEAGNYLGKLVSLRSVMFCQSPGQTFCETCAGPRLSRFKKGLAIPATDMTSAILAASMAAMHKNTTTTTTIDLEMAIT